jgi:hypothetical protein
MNLTDHEASDREAAESARTWVEAICRYLDAGAAMAVIVGVPREAFVDLCGRAFDTLYRTSLNAKTREVEYRNADEDKKH